MSVLSSTAQIDLSASPNSGLDRTAIYPAKATPNISISARHSSRPSGGIRISGRTVGVVVGELVDVVILDKHGKGVAFLTKISGNGRFKIYPNLSKLSPGRLSVVAVTTSIDGACIKAESFQFFENLDTSVGVSNVNIAARLMSSVLMTRRKMVKAFKSLAFHRRGITSWLKKLPIALPLRNAEARKVSDQ